MLEESFSRPQDAHLIFLLAAAFLVLLAKLLARTQLGDFLRLPWHPAHEDLAADYRPLQSRHESHLALALSASLVFLSLLVSLHQQNSEGAFEWLFALRVFLWLNSLILLKFSLALFIGWVFDCQEDLARGQNIFLAHLNWLQFPLAIGLILFHYLAGAKDILAPILLVITILGFALAWFRQAQYLLRQSLGRAHLFFYLCALEITPFLYLKIFW